MSRIYSYDMSSTLIIEVKQGGLGDHLFHSHLPRIAKTVGGFKTVVVSTQSPIRSRDYWQLVWRNNPYVDGETELAGRSCGDALATSASMNLLDSIMLAYGMDDGIRMHEPEVFGITQSRSDVSSITVFDPNFVSGVGRIDARRLESWMRQEDLFPDLQLAPRATAYSLPRVPCISTKDIYDYCSVIKGCGRFITFTSGGATLAAALGKSAVALYGEGQHPSFHHSPQHRYLKVPLGARKRLYFDAVDVAARVQRRFHGLLIRQPRSDSI